MTKFGYPYNDLVICNDSTAYLIVIINIPSSYSKLVTGLINNTNHDNIYIDGHKSKPAMCILAIIEESQKTLIISNFATLSFYD